MGYKTIFRREQKMFEKFFKLKENNTTVGTEVVAGLSTFMTMAYIIALNPNLLTGFGANGQELWNAVFMATVISAAVGTLLMGILANKPFALAPGMGLNSYFATVVAQIAAAAGISYVEGFQAGLVIILISGILFTILTIFKVREKIVNAIPKAVRVGIPAGIGLMLVNIGFTSNAGLGTFADYYMLNGFFGNGASVTKATLGADYKMMVLYVITTFIGIFLMAVLSQKKVKGAVLIGMLGSSVVFFIGKAIIGVNPFAALEGASFIPPFKDMFEVTFFKFNFKDLFSIGVFSAIMTIISFCMVDMFDTIGTLYGTAKRANMIDEDGNMPNMQQAMLSDSIATCVGACTGTSTVTTFVESGTGIAAGGKTGLSSLVTAILFALSIFLLPLFAFIPSAAAAGALMYVGVLMMKNVKGIDLDSISASATSFVTILMMVLTYSITKGIGMGVITYVLIEVVIYLVKGVRYLLAKNKENVKKPTWNISIVLLVVFVLFLIYLFVPTVF